VGLKFTQARRLAAGSAAVDFGFVPIYFGLAVGAILFSVHRDCLKFFESGGVSLSSSGSPLIH
jgi:hypothetical protein